jgi:hypothetical protein
MKTELPIRLLLDRLLSSSTCCLFFLLALYFKKINRLSAKGEKGERTVIRYSHDRYW